MNKELLKLKKALVKAIQPNKEDIQAEKLQKLIMEARSSKDYDIKQLVKEFGEIFQEVGE